MFWWDGNSSTEKIEMRKSTNQGSTFGSTITVGTLKTTGSDGDLGLTTGSAGPTPNLSFRTNAFPMVAVNPTNSQDLYVVYDDVGQASGDKADIYFTQSSNGGTSWSTPIKVVGDTTIHDQWQPALAVTPDGKHIFITWYDRRNDTTNSLIDRYGVIGSISGSTVAFGANFKITKPDSGATTTSFPAVVGQDPSIASDYTSDYDVATAATDKTGTTYFYTTWGDNRLSDSAHTKQPDVRFEKITTSGGIVFSPISSASASIPSKLTNAPPVEHSTALEDGALAGALGTPPAFGSEIPAASPGLGQFSVLVPSLFAGTGEARNVGTAAMSAGPSAAGVDRVFTASSSRQGPSLIALGGAGEDGSPDASAAVDDFPGWQV